MKKGVLALVITIIILIVIISVLWAIVVYAKEETPSLVGMGCSVPTFVKNSNTFKMKEASQDFQPACVIHDYCYRCGSCTYGKKKIYCDQQFKQNMLELCDSNSDPNKCKKKANLFYWAVRLFGYSAYKNVNRCIYHHYNYSMSKK
jgi:hypothetical protein